jgi:transposase
MLTWPANMRIYLSVAPTDMRKQFDGLSALVESVFGKQVLDGHLFVFLNRRRDRLKILMWDRDGLVIFAKRLEQGTFQLPEVTPETTSLELDATQLSLILSGIELRSAQRRKRYQPAA